MYIIAAGENGEEYRVFIFLLDSNFNVNVSS